MKTTLLYGVCCLTVVAMGIGLFAMGWFNQNETPIKMSRHAMLLGGVGMFALGCHELSDWWNARRRKP